MACPDDVLMLATDHDMLLMELINHQRSPLEKNLLGSEASLSNSSSCDKSTSRFSTMSQT